MQPCRHRERGTRHPVDTPRVYGAATALMAPGTIFQVPGNGYRELRNQSWLGSTPEYTASRRRTNGFRIDDLQSYHGEHRFRIIIIGIMLPSRRTIPHQVHVDPRATGCGMG